MKSPALRIAAVIGIVAILAGVVWLVIPRGNTAQPAGLDSLPIIEGDYRRANQDDRLEFPEAFGPQPDFQTEWWYYTGNLQAADGRHFGYQLTFFRRSIVSPGQGSVRVSSWATEQVYMAHFTLTDTGGQRFQYFERFSRGAAGLAGASIEDGFEVWLENWNVRETAPGVYALHAAQEDIALDLTLTDRKGPVLQGINGYSQKGSDPGNASLYFSQTRLDSEGSVTVSGGTYEVSGSSWMDREISTSALSEGEVGWDWFALQLSDGSDLMLYQIRRANGSISEFSSGLLVRPDGTTQLLTRDDVTLEVQDTWRSPHSGGEYPAGWQVRIASQGIDLRVQPVLADQELSVSVVYWEGAVQVSGSVGGAAVDGRGYVELTGYAGSLGGKL